MMNLAGIHLGDEVSLRGIRDIVFPQHNDHVSHIAIDIGGSLAKIAYFTRHSHGSGTSSPSPDASMNGSGGRGTPTGSGGRLNFVKFETEKIDECIAFIKRVIEDQEHEYIDEFPNKPLPPRVLLATGGGAHKFHQRLSTELNATIIKHDEMECLVKGLNFLVRHVPREVFLYRDIEPVQFEETPPSDPYPYMLVNIGSGVSILKVTADNQFERISGTSLGGGTYWGLMSLIADRNCSSQSNRSLSPAPSFDQMLELSTMGDNSNIDMLVGDIYGMDYNKIGLKSTTIASSFGKMFKKTPEERSSISINDASRALLYMVSNNIGQIAYLNARAHNIKRIYFGGYFICGHPVTMNSLSYAVSWWSKGEMRALFLRHEGYIGAVGAFLQDQQELAPPSEPHNSDHGSLQT